MEATQELKVPQLKWIASRLHIDISQALEKRELIKAITEHFEPPPAPNQSEIPIEPPVPQPAPIIVPEPIEVPLESSSYKTEPQIEQNNVEQSKLEQIIAKLSTKQLKAILINHHISTKTFFEKCELQEAVIQFCRTQGNSPYSSPEYR